MILIPYAILFLLVVLIAIATARQRLIAWRTDAVVGTLALILGQNLPLAVALRAAARHERRRLRSIFNHFAAYIETGASIESALQGAWPACPSHVLGALRGAQEGGTLPSVARSLAIESRHDKQFGTERAPALLYFLFMSLIVGGMLLLYMIFLLPQFKTILLDYGIKEHPFHDQLAALTVLLRHMLPVILPFIALCLLLIIFRILQGFFPTWLGRGEWLSAIGSVIAWHLPLARRVAESRSLGRQLLVLRSAIRAGQDLGPAAAQASEAAVNVCARRRMRRWAALIQSGDTPRESARRTKMPEPLRYALANARNPDELTAALDYLSSYYRSLQAHWERMIAAAAMPVVVTFWGICVAYFCMLTLLPIYSIVDTLIEVIY